MCEANNTIIATMHTNEFHGHVPAPFQILNATAEPAAAFVQLLVTFPQCVSLLTGTSKWLVRFSNGLRKVKSAVLFHNYGSGDGSNDASNDGSGDGSNDGTVNDVVKTIDNGNGTLFTTLGFVSAGLLLTLTVVGLYAYKRKNGHPEGEGEADADDDFTCYAASARPDLPEGGSLGDEAPWSHDPRPVGHSQD